MKAFDWHQVESLRRQALSIARDLLVRAQSLVDDSPLLPLMFLSGVLYTMGNSILQDEPRLRSVVSRMSLVLFVIYCGQALARRTVWDAEWAVPVVVRGFLLAGITTGVLSAVLRVLVLTMHVLLHNPVTALPGRLTKMIGRAWGRVTAEVRRQRSRWNAPSPEQVAEAERRRRDEEARRVTAEQERLDRHWRQAQEVAARRAQREELRLQLQLFYDRYALPLKNLFTRSQLKQFFTANLNDEQPVDVVQKRCEQLKAMLTDLMGYQPENAPRFRTVEEVVQHFKQRRAAIRELDVEEGVRETLEITLDEAQDNALREVLQ